MERPTTNWAGSPQSITPGADDLYYVLSDRGPKDGSASAIYCRWHMIELKLPQEADARACLGTRYRARRCSRPPTANR